jgi:ketosteroid isomerase-like protein
VFGYLDEDFEWRTVFLGETFRGQVEAARAWDDFLAWAEDYRPTLEDVADLGGDYAFVVIGLAGTSKDSARTMDARFFDIFTIRDGKIARIEEYSDRSEALEAANRAKRGLEAG